MTDLEKFERVASAKWEEITRAEREKKLSSNLVADIWVGKNKAINFGTLVQEWVYVEKMLLSLTPHPTDDVDNAQRALRKIGKAIRKDPKKLRIKIAVSGFDILALEKVMAKPSRKATAHEIGQYTEAMGFLNRVTNAYIRNPDKYNPVGRSFIKRAVAIFKQKDLKQN